MKRLTSLLMTLLTAMLFLTQCASVKYAKQHELAEQNKETIRIWFEEGWNKNRNMELIERCFDPEWNDGNPILADQLSGHEGMRQLVKNYKEGASDAYFTITHLYANEKYATIRYEVIAHHTGNLFGIPATGKQFTSSGLVLYEMRDGRILVSWQELDMTGIINQLRN